MPKINKIRNEAVGVCGECMGKLKKIDLEQALGKGGFQVVCPKCGVKYEHKGK